MKKLMTIAVLFCGIQAMATSAISRVENWGGDGISLTVFSDQSVNLTFDCASGNIPAGRWQVNQSRNAAVGTFRKEMGAYRPGPGVVRSEKATYAANIDVSKGTMTLTRKLAKSKSIFKLIKGQDGNLRRCM